MIALNETNEYSAEIPFFLPDVSNPLEGLTGHVFVLGEVQIKLPGAGSWTNVPVLKIVEKDHGWYAIRLTAVQCTVEGEVKWRVKDSAITATFQPGRGSETVGTLGGDIAVDGTGYLMFYLPDAVDPIYADPILGAFPAGTIRYCLPDAAFVDGDPDLVVEFGDGLYGYPLVEADTTKAGKALVFATATGAQSAGGYKTILGTGVAPDAPPSEPPGDPIEAPIVYVPAGYEDHIAGAVSRLPQQFQKRVRQ